MPLQIPPSSQYYQNPQAQLSQPMNLLATARMPPVSAYETQLAVPRHLSISTAAYGVPVGQPAPGSGLVIRRNASARRSATNLAGQPVARPTRVRVLTKKILLTLLPRDVSLLFFVAFYTR